MNNIEYTQLVKNAEYPKDPLVPLDPAFINAAGKIQNLINGNIGAVAIIHSIAGSTRSNHWHKNNWHYLYVISGVVKYFERNVDGTDILIKEYKEGDMFFTPPHKVHKTEFLTDCILLSIGKESKEHSAHEEDLVRVEF